MSPVMRIGVIKKNRLDFYRNFFVVSAILLCCQVAAAQQEFTVEGIALGMRRHYCEKGCAHQ